VIRFIVLSLAFPFNTEAHHYTSGDGNVSSAPIHELFLPIGATARSGDDAPVAASPENAA
jgi:hypothetical protein